MSKYIILKPDTNNKLELIEKGLTLDEAQEYVGDDDTLLIVEDFNP